MKKEKDKVKEFMRKIKTNSFSRKNVQNTLLKLDEEKKKKRKFTI